MTRPTFQTGVLTASLALAAVLAAGCGDDGANPPPAPTPTATTAAPAMTSTSAPATGETAMGETATGETATGETATAGEGMAGDVMAKCEAPGRCGHRVENPVKRGYLLKWQKQLEDGTHEYVLSACFGKHASCPVKLNQLAPLEFELVHDQVDTVDAAKLDTTSITFTSGTGSADIQVTIHDGCPDSPVKIRNDQAPDFCMAGTPLCK